MLQNRKLVRYDTSNKYYMLTIAGSASGWVLRGEENMSGLQYLDYASLMSYDLHGTWNQYVGPNSPLFDDGNDAGLTETLKRSCEFGKPNSLGHHVTLEGDHVRTQYGLEDASSDVVESLSR